MDFSQDELATVLARIADRRTGIYPPGSWRQVATSLVSEMVNIHRYPRVP